MSTAINIEGLSKRYAIAGSGSYLSLRDAVTAKFSRKSPSQKTEDFWAIRDLDLQIGQGDRIGIIGRNGAGKSTLLKILSRITPPTKGRITLKGRVASLLEVGTGFHPELSGRDNIYFNGSILGMKKKEIDRKLDEIIEFSGIEKFLHTNLKHYSSGMQLRLAFSVAAHLEPEILLIDEVLAVGDMEFQKKCMGKMEEVSRSEGRTILFVSHNMNYITSLCNSAILLEQGRLEFSGQVTEVVNRYMSNVRAKGQSLTADAGRDAVARLISIRTTNSVGEPKESFGADEAVVINMEYEVMQTGQILWLGLNIHNENGQNVFDTHSVGTELYDRAHETGVYTATATIPAHLLNTGNYFVSAAVFNHLNAVIHFHEKDILLFNVHDVFNTLTARGMSPGEFPGVVRPLLPWTINKNLL